jgi:hypothetical protein
VHLDSIGRGRVMDTDAEYKIFDDLARKLQNVPESNRVGTLDLFTKRNFSSVRYF